MILVYGRDLSNGTTDNKKLGSSEMSMTKWISGFASKETRAMLSYRELCDATPNFDTY